jgi:hypothetical protein
MKVKVNQEIVNEIDYTISSLVSDDRLPVALEKLATGEPYRYGVIIELDAAQAADLSYWVARDMDHKADVVLATCLEDRDTKAAQGVRRYVAKCGKLINELKEIQ